MRPDSRVGKVRSAMRRASLVTRRKHLRQEAAAGLGQAQSAYTGARVEMEAKSGQVRASMRQVAPPSIDPQQARKSLPPGSLFLGYSVGEDQTILFLVRPEPA